MAKGAEHKPGSGVFGFGKRGLLEKGLFRKVYLLEILENVEILEILENLHPDCGK